MSIKPLALMLASFHCLFAGTPSVAQIERTPRASRWAGATAWVCWNQEETDVLWMQPTALWEMEHLYDLTPANEPSDSVEQELEQLKLRLRAADPYFGRDLTEHLDWAVNNFELRNVSLPLDRESDYPLRPTKRDVCPNGKFLDRDFPDQLASSTDDRLIINRFLWQQTQLNSRGKAAILTYHALVHLLENRERRPDGPFAAVKVRRAVAFLFAQLSPHTLGAALSHLHDYRPITLAAEEEIQGDGFMAAAKLSQGHIVTTTRLGRVEVARSDGGQWQRETPLINRSGAANLLDWDGDRFYLAGDLGGRGGLFSFRATTGQVQRIPLPSLAPFRGLTKVEAEDDYLVGIVSAKHQVALVSIDPAGTVIETKSLEDPRWWPTHFEVIYHPTSQHLYLLAGTPRNGCLLLVKLDASTFDEKAAVERCTDAPGYVEPGALAIAANGDVLVGAYHYHRSWPVFARFSSDLAPLQFKRLYARGAKVVDMQVDPSRPVIYATIYGAQGGSLVAITDHGNIVAEVWPYLGNHPSSPVTGWVDGDTFHGFGWTETPDRGRIGMSFSIELP